MGSCSPRGRKESDTTEHAQARTRGVFVRLRMTCAHMLAQNVLWESADEPFTFIMDS